MGIRIPGVGTVEWRGRDDEGPEEDPPERSGDEYLKGVPAQERERLREEWEAAYPLPPPPPAPEPVGVRLPSGPPPPAKRFTWIFGASGMGKTVEMNIRYARRIARGMRGIYVDVKGTNGHMGRSCGSVPELLRYVRGEVAARRSFSAVLDAAGLDPDEVSPVWELANRLGSVVVASDEVDAWAHSGDGNKLRPESLRRMVGHGRELGVELITTARNIAELHRDFRNSASVVVTFRQESARQTETTVREFFYSRSELVDAIQRLQKFQFLQVDRESGEIASGRTWPPGTEEGNAELLGRRLNHPCRAQHIGGSE